MNTQQKKQNNPADTIKDLSNLEAIAEYAIGAMIEECPNYFREHEKALAKSIRDYGVDLIQECRNSGLLKLPDNALEEITENRMGSILDISYILNREYFKSGIQFGTLLIIQMLF